MRTLLLSLVLAVPAAAQLRAPLPAWKPPFKAATPATVTRLKTVLGSDAGASLMKNPAFAVLTKLDPSVESHLALAGVLELGEDFDVPQLVAAYKDRDAERLIAESIESRADAVFHALNENSVEREQFISAAEELGAFARWSSNAGKLQSLAAEARSESGMSLARLSAAQLVRGWGTEDLPGGVFAGPRASDSRRLEKDPRLTEAKLELAELGKAKDEISFRRSVDHLTAIAGSGVSQDLQRLIATGIASAASRATASGSVMIVLGSARSVAVASGDPKVELAAISRLLGEYPHLLVDERDLALEAVAEIAIRSKWPFVKQESVRMLRRAGNTPDGDYEFDFEAPASFQARIDKIADSAGGMDKLFPTPPTPKSPLANATSELEKLSDSFMKELSEGVQKHPFGAFFGLLVAAGVVAGLATTGWYLPALALIAAGLVYVGAQGLYHGHPWGVFFHLAQLGDIFEKFVEAGVAVDPLQAALIALAAPLAGAISIWSFRNHRPILGYFMMSGVVMLFHAMTLGTKFFDVYFKVTGGN